MDKRKNDTRDLDGLNSTKEMDTSKTKQDTGFDPTKANVNGTSLDDEDPESEEKPRLETDDSRRSSYDTGQKRRGSVHGGYRQPIPSTNGQQHPSNKDGLDSRATDTTSILKDSGYSDAGGGSRFETPDEYLGTASSTDYDSSTPFDRQRQKDRPMMGGRKQPESSTDDPSSGILKAIVDDYDETKEDDYYHRIFKDRCGIPLETPEPRIFNDSYGFPLDVPDEDEVTTTKASTGYRNGIVNRGTNGGGASYAPYPPEEMPVLEKHSNIYLKDVRANLGPEVQTGKRTAREKPNLISPDYMEGQDR